MESKQLKGSSWGNSFVSLLKYVILLMICLLAFGIRLFAVVRYESVIHEFDPYFNFRATKFLAHEGFLAFLDWFDDRGWYPLGRTIGGTIYPGLMLTAANLYWLLDYFHFTVNIRNVCVFLAPLFSANASLASYLLTTEVTKKSSTGLLAAALTAIVPSYISRSVGGSYDNEGVAIFALILTFYLWVKSVNTGSMMWSCFCALSYYYMVAAWGGYVFIINVIPIYCVVMVLAGRFSHRLYIAYSVFYVLGSIMAMTVPFVGFNVVGQAECAASHGVFIGLQAFAIIHALVGKLDTKVLQRILIILLFFIVVAAVAAGLIYLQLDGRVRWSGRSLTLLDPTYASKFIPIIASVSEHQPTSWTAFFFDLHMLVPMAPLGLLFLFGSVSDGGIFLLIYGTIAWYFAGVMVRLMLTLAPIACILAAIALSTILSHFSTILKNVYRHPTSSSSASLALMVIIGITALLLTFLYHATFTASAAYSNPSIVIEAGQYPDGRRVIHDDYREAYYWLRMNTEPSAKILSWWDYGYQLSAMANRTVLVDNNTWNNTHIATVGRALASSEENAYPILQSLDVDYVLIIFGGYSGYASDDINKFLWPIRIGRDVFPNDMPTESEYYADGSGSFDIGSDAPPALRNSLLYKLSYYRFGNVPTEYGRPTGYDRSRMQEIGDKNIRLDTLEEAFTSENWVVRIYKVKPRSNWNPYPIKKKSVATASSTKSKTVSSTRTSASSDKESKKQKASSNDETTAMKNKKNTKASKAQQQQRQQQQQQTKDKETEQQPQQQSSSHPNEKNRAKYLGCYGSETFFDDAKMYFGGSTGANFHMIAHEAIHRKHRYFAIARGDTDGHSFIFQHLHKPDTKHLKKLTNLHGQGCERPCLDTAAKFCGCVDTYCVGMTLSAEEENNRRWAVYEVI